MGVDKTTALRALRDCRSALTRQQTQTLRGQILNGQVEDAMRGLAKIIERGVARHAI